MGKDALVGVLEKEVKAAPRLNPSSVILQGTIGDRTMTLARVDAATGTLWFEDVVTQATSLGRREAGLRYYEALASLVADEKLRAKKKNPHTITGTASLPADDLLSRQADWLAAIRTYSLKSVTR